MSNQSTVIEPRGSNRLRRIARILSGLIIAVGIVIFVMQILDPGPTVENYPAIENLLPALMMLSILSLALAWRWELMGAILSLGFFILHLILYWAIRGQFFPSWALINLTPIPLTAVLFLILGLRSGSS